MERDGSQIGRQGTMGQIAVSRISCNKVTTQQGGVVTRGATRNRGVVMRGTTRNQGEKGRIVHTRSQLREPQRMQGSKVKGSAEAQSQVAVAVRKLQFAIAVRCHKLQVAGDAGRCSRKLNTSSEG